MDVENLVEKLKEIRNRLHLACGGCVSARIMATDAEGDKEMLMQYLDAIGHTSADAVDKLFEVDGMLDGIISELERNGLSIDINILKGE